MAKPIKWTTEKRKISDLVPHPDNPRRMTEKQTKDLTASLSKFDLAEIPVINTDNQLLAGHQRCKIMQLLDRGDEEIDVRVPTRKLTKKEASEYLIRSNKNTGEWDWDLLNENFEMKVLEDFGFEDFDFPEAGEGGAGGDGKPAPNYSRKIESPIYQIKGDKPEIADMIKCEKHQQLMAELESAEVPEDVREFLRLASYRHVVFDYGKIAEFYAHADAQIQDLMEKSALVIIDFDKAIENGFVMMSKELADITGKDYDKD